MRINKRKVNDGNVLLEGIPEIPGRLAERLNRYHNVRAASFEAWTADGSGVYVTTRFGEVDQLHCVAMPGGARRQLTFFPEPPRDFRRQPGGPLLAFSMDEGGSELYQIHVFDPATGASRRLTDGASRNRTAVWSRDGRRIAFLSTRRNGRANDVWVMGVDDPSSARMAVEAPDGYIWTPVDWSAGGDRLVVRQYLSVGDSRLHVLDLMTDELTLVAGGGAEPSTNASAFFDATDRGLFLATDQRSEFTELAHLDLGTGDLEIVTGDVPWSVTGICATEDRSRIAFVANEDGVGRLYLMDAASRRYRRLDGLPAGLVVSAGFSPDGRRLALTLNTAAVPSDVFTLDLGAGDARPCAPTPGRGPEVVWWSPGPPRRWTWSELGGLDPGGLVEPELVRYPTFDEVDGGPRLVPAFVYRPRRPGPHPVVVFLHGGPEGQSRPSFNGLVQVLIAELGCAVAAPNFRGSLGYGKEYLRLDNGYRREDSVKDVGALLDWIAASPDLDADRVAVVGGSYGGYMVLSSLVHYGDRLRAGVDVVGISNFVTFLENTRDYRRDSRREEYGDERDPEMRAFLDRISPTRNAGKITAPLLVAQGQNDPRVPVTESDQIVAEVRAAGYDVWYMKALNEGHGFARKENRDLFHQIVVLFLERYLVGEPVTFRPTKSAGRTRSA
jgi:dipeptidyl aminopeptidase/acylaminoacyl peptidase